MQLKGGFGNQLFQFACGYALSKEKECGLGIDLTYFQTWPVYKLNYTMIKNYSEFNPRLYKGIVGKIANPIIKKYKIIGDRTVFNFDKDSTIYNSDIQNCTDDCYLTGYFQNERYFMKYRKDIVSMFQPNYELDDSEERLFRDVNGVNSVAIHVRRGDYVGIGFSIDMEYYHKAIERAKLLIENPVFYVFSDDLDFCRDFFSKYEDLKIVYVDSLVRKSTQDVSEFFGMSKCKHQIIANSTFSWWAAWLNNNPNRVVIAPEIGVWKGDFYPKDWITIKA